MTLSALSHVWRKSNASGAQLLVMLVLADNCDELNVCESMSIDYLCRQARIRPDELKPTLEKLFELEEIHSYKIGVYNVGAYLNIPIPVLAPSTTPKQPKIPSKLRRAVHKRDGYKCRYCGMEPDDMCIDHVIPSSRGGETVLDNLVTACRSCNSTKGARTPEEAGMKLQQL